MAAPLSRKQMTAWLSTPLDDLDLRVLVIDGIIFHDHTVVIVDSTDADLAKRRLESLASSLEVEHPGAAGSIREGWTRR